MSFFEPRLKPLPDAFYSEGDASPVRSKVLRRIPTWPGYVPYKLLELVDGESEATSICDQDPIIPLWPSTDDELETDVGQEKTETETWQAQNPKISMETQIQRKDEPAVKQEASSKVQVNLEAALADPPSTSFGPSLTMLPLEHRGQRSDHTLDECNSFRPPEKVPSFSCVSRGVLNGYVCPQYATQPHMLQPKQSEIKAANYEAFKKPVPQKSRNAHEKHGTPNGTPGSSKNVGLQQPAGTNAQKSVDPLEILENEQTVKAMKVGEAAKKKSQGNRKGEGDEGKGHGETHDAGRGPHAASACAPASACARGSSSLWKSQWTSRSEVVDSCKA